MSPLFALIVIPVVFVVAALCYSRVVELKKMRANVGLLRSSRQESIIKLVELEEQLNLLADHESMAQKTDPEALPDPQITNPTSPPRTSYPRYERLVRTRINVDPDTEIFPLRCLHRRGIRYQQRIKIDVGRIVVRFRRVEPAGGKWDLVHLDNGSDAYGRRRELIEDFSEPTLVSTVPRWRARPL